MGIQGKKLNAKRWGATRRLVLIRDGYRCKSCAKAGRLEVDHIRPLARGGDPWALDNLQALCRQCHFAKTRKEQGHDVPQDRLDWQPSIKELL